MRIKTFLRHPRFSSDTTGMALWKSAFSQWKCSCVDSRARKVRGGAEGGGDEVRRKGKGEEGGRGEEWEGLKKGIGKVRVGKEERRTQR